MNSGFPFGQVAQTGIDWKGLSPASVLQSFLGHSCLGDGELCDKENPYFSEGAMMPRHAGWASGSHIYVSAWKSAVLLYFCNILSGRDTQKYCHLCRSSRVGSKGKDSCTFPWVSRKAGSKSIYIPALSLPIHIFRNFQISFQLWATLSFHCLLLSSWDFSDLRDCQGCLLLLSYNYCLSCILVQVALLCASHTKKGQVVYKPRLIKVNFRFNRAPEQNINLITWYCITLHWRSGKDEQYFQRDSYYCRENIWKLA